MRASCVKYKNLYCIKSGLIIPVESDTWWNWLLVNNSFRYEYEGVNCHFHKDKKGYWTAIKVVNKYRRQKRMGIDRDLTFENMLNVCFCLNAVESDYQIFKENSKQHSPLDSRTYLKDEVKRLRSEVARLKKKIQNLESNQKRRVKEDAIFSDEYDYENRTPDDYWIGSNGKKIPVYYD